MKNPLFQSYAVALLAVCFVLPGHLRLLDALVGVRAQPARSTASRRTQPVVRPTQSAQLLKSTRIYFNFQLGAILKPSLTASDKAGSNASKLGLTLSRNCHNLTRIFTPGINWV